MADVENGQTTPGSETQSNAPASDPQVGHKNTKTGHVVSIKMKDTIVVEVTRRVPHPLYKRIVTKRKKFYADDKGNTAKLGDWVRIKECRPLSRLKRWTLDEIVRRAVQVGAIDTTLAGTGLEAAQR